MKSQLGDVEQEIRLGEKEVALFGYGSLLSRKSMESTLGREYQYPWPPAVCSLPNFKRTWNALEPNDSSYYARTESGILTPTHIIYLNVTACPTHAVNGVVLVLREDDIALFDAREAPTYERVNITGQLRGVRLTQGHGYMYSAKPEWLLGDTRSPQWAAIRQSYVDKVNEGVSQLGEQFGLEYDKSTDPVPRELVINDNIEKQLLEDPEQ